MISKLNRTYNFSFVTALCVLLIGFGLSNPINLSAQTTISTGSIVGTVTDPSGAVVPNASVTITNKRTGQTIHVTTTSSGTYASGALLPGDYTVSVTAKGFKTTVVPVTVQVGVTSTGNAALELGQATTMVEVQTSALQVNTVQPTVQGTVSRQEIRNLPVNGRNFLDLAALQPGVQIQDGSGFDPTKNGFSSVSFDGRFGRTARIEVDGVDISDETVGTTTQNIPQSAIEEFQVEQSTLDPSTELTSSGAINVTTRSGTNGYHGDAFFAGRWHNVDARQSTTDVFMRRAQWGVDVGGPIVKNKLFFFLDWERTRQDLLVPVRFSSPFTALSGGFNGPFREHELLGRMDWNISSNWRAFARVSFDQNSNVADFAPYGPAYSPFANVDRTPVYAFGVDGTTGRFTHAIRFGYTHFHNEIADAVSGTGIYNPTPGAELHISGFRSGPNLLAPQETLQYNRQIKYDGSYIAGKHILSYGIGWNHILGGGFAKFFGIAPELISSTSASVRAVANTGPFPGGDTNPLNYPVLLVESGNGQGYFTNLPQLGLPAGGQFDNRIQWYVADTWKVRRNFTWTMALRYVRDTGRTDSQFPAIPILNQFGPGLGDPVHQPNRNFAPTVGFAWDVMGNGKTVIRAGAGLYYENAIFNNILFDQPGRLEKGLFFGLAFPCPSGAYNLPGGGTIDTSAYCGQPIGSVYKQLAAAQTQFQTATIAAGAAANGNYIGNTLANGVNSTGNNFIAPDYRTPFSEQMNIGVSRQLGPNTVLSANYVRNVGLHFLLAYDTNHVGDARYLNQAAALNAINVTNEAFSCPDGPGGIGCAITAGATIDDYAGNGLDAGTQYLSALPAAELGLTPDTGAAFPGINPNLGENQMLFPIGRSVYNGLLVSFKHNSNRPFRGVHALTFGANYALSRAESQAQDQDFINIAWDFNNINHYIGPNGLDRTHQLSLFGVFNFAHGLIASFSSTVGSPLPSDLYIAPTDPNGIAEIFKSDVTGDGTSAAGNNGAEILPGTNIGAFSRSVNSVSALNAKISAFNSAYAGKLTPAGKALVNAGLFTESQLVSLGATPQTIAAAPAGQVFNDSFISTNLNVGYSINPHFGGALENFTIQPNISVFNLFNVANYNTVQGFLDGAGGDANGTVQGDRTNLITLGSGVFGGGAPRMIEWGVKINW
jgi:Carboxypeptidase regulatory-like domain